MIFILFLSFNQCKKENQAGQESATKLDTVPQEFHGEYCSDERGDCHTFSISATSVWDSAMGGCPQVKSILQKGDTFEVKCEIQVDDAQDVTIQKLGKGKISFKLSKGETHLFTHN